MGTRIVKYCGRRADIVWKKSSFIGTGGRRDYDTHRAIGFVFPFWLNDPIHTFGWSQINPKGRAILLRPDRGFKFQACLQDLGGAIAIIALIAAPVLGCVALLRRMENQPTGSLYLAASVLSLVYVIGFALIYFYFRTLDRHERDIRLVLGKHAWGSSDPAYWHADLLESLRAPKEAFGVQSYAALARKCIKEAEWDRAMWAARLCTAVEDCQRGEKLTDEIMAQAEVEALLGEIRKDPSRRSAVFGKPIPLETWITGDPDQQIFPVTG